MDKNCAVFVAANILGKRWTLIILLELYKGESKWKRYNQLKSKLPQLTPKILSTRLKELEREGIIAKKVDSSTVPIKSEYSLTKQGEQLIDILKELKKWSLQRGDTKQFKNIDCKSTDCKNCGF